MKKFILRVMASMMSAAIIILSTGYASVVYAAEDAANLNISERVFVSGEAPADNADGSITFSDQKTMKCSFALPNALNAGDTIKVNVKLRFDSSEDAGVRFYLIANGTDVNTAVDIHAIENESIGSEIEKSFTLTAAAASTELLFASSGYGINIENITISEISLGDKPAATSGSTAEPVSLNISERIFKSGAEPVDNADGSITFSDQKSMKCSFALPETLVAGDSIHVKVRLKFDSSKDAGVRFYLIADGADSNIATDIQSIATEKIGSEIVKSFTLTAASDATELLFASSSYGVNIENVTIYEITLGDNSSAAPVIESTGGEYIVQPGDTLGKIAAACGLNIKVLADANNITDVNKLYAGTKLVIPASYVVVSGDTLSEIAAAHGCSVADLVKANGIENINLIYVGQVILLP